MFHGRALDRWWWWWRWGGGPGMLQFSQTKIPWKFVTPECWLAVLGGVSEPEPSLTLLASGGQEGLWGAPSGLSVRLSPPLLDTDQRSSQLQGSTVPQYHSTGSSGHTRGHTSHLMDNYRSFLFLSFSTHGSQSKTTTMWYNSFYGNFNENTRPLY